MWLFGFSELCWHLRHQSHVFFPPTCFLQAGGADGSVFSGLWKVLHCQQQYFKCHWAPFKGLPAASSRSPQGKVLMMKQSLDLLCFRCRAYTLSFHSLTKVTPFCWALTCYSTWIPLNLNNNTSQRSSSLVISEKCNIDDRWPFRAAFGERPSSCGPTGGRPSADQWPQHLSGALQSSHHGSTTGTTRPKVGTLSQSLSSSKHLQSHEAVTFM